MHEYFNQAKKSPSKTIFITILNNVFTFKRSF